MRSLALAWMAGIGIAATGGPARSAEPARGDTGYDDKRWAIVIGVGSYAGGLGGALPDLRGPPNDARRISEALINKGRFDPRHVVVLADGTALPPTGSNITAQLDEVSRGTKDGLLVFFFAGHGVAVDGESYLLPSDVRGLDHPGGPLFKRTALPVSTVRDIIADNKVTQVVLMLDACRNNPASTAPLSHGATLLQNSEGFRQAFVWNNTATFFATQSGMEAYESGGVTSVGYFADVLARALIGAEPDAIQRGEVTVASLLNFLPEGVDRRVQTELPGRHQRPEVVLKVSGRIVLSFTTEPPTPDVRLLLRLPAGIVARGGLRVHMDKFSLQPGSLAQPIARRPGRHFVEVSLPGYWPWRQEVDLPADEAVNVISVNLQPRRWPLVAALAGAGAGVAAMVAGFAYGARAESLSTEVTNACGPGKACDWAGTYQAKDHDGRRAQALFRTFLLSGGILTALGAGAAGYFHWSRPPLSSDTGRIDIAPGPTAAGVSVLRSW